MRRKNPDTETLVLLVGGFGALAAVLYYASKNASGGSSSNSGATPAPAGGTAGDGDVPNPTPDDSAFSTSGDGIGDD
jgi:hypothetical protein